MRRRQLKTKVKTELRKTQVVMKKNHDESNWVVTFEIGDCLFEVEALWSENSKEEHEFEAMFLIPFRYRYRLSS